jgi:hypothetical protein
VIDKSNASLGGDTVNMLTTLRMNREFGHKLALLYAGEKFDDTTGRLEGNWAELDLFEVDS